MSEFSYRVALDEAFQSACQRYAHAGGSSSAIAAAALRASGAEDMLEVLEAELAGLEGDIRWAHDSDLDRLIKRSARMEAALSKARGQ